MAALSFDSVLTAGRIEFKPLEEETGEEDGLAAFKTSSEWCLARRSQETDKKDFGGKGGKEGDENDGKAGMGAKEGKDGKKRRRVKLSSIPKSGGSWAASPEGPFFFKVQVAGEKQRMNDRVLLINALGLTTFNVSLSESVDHVPFNVIRRYKVSRSKGTFTFEVLRKKGAEGVLYTFYTQEASSLEAAFSFYTTLIAAKAADKKKGEKGDGKSDGKSDDKSKDASTAAATLLASDETTAGLQSSSYFLDDAMLGKSAPASLATFRLQAVPEQRAVVKPLDPPPPVARSSPRSPARSARLSSAIHRSAAF